MTKLVAWVKTELPMITGLVQAALALGVSIGGLNTTQAGWIEGAAAALLAAIVAIGTRPLQIAAITGAIQAIGVVLVAYRVPHVTTGEISAVNAFVAATLALMVRSHVSPVASQPAPVAPVASTAGTAAAQL